MSWRFAQISDTHFGVKLAQLDTSVADALRQAMRDAVAQCFHQAAEAGVAAVLLPGDLYDIKGNGAAEGLRYIYDEAKKYPAIKFIISPGNADAYGIGCPYIEVPAPDNVYIFTSQAWRTIEVEGASITSRAFHTGEGIPQMNWLSLPSPHPIQPAVLMLHGTLVGANDGRDHRIKVMPFTKDEILRAGYSYAALGHLHTKIELRGLNELVAGAYSGIPQCLSWDEQEPGGFILGELERAGARISFHPTAKHALKQRTIPLPPLYVERYPAKLDAAHHQLTSNLEPTDLLRLKLHGELAEKRREEIDSWLAQARDAVYHFAQPDLSDLRFTESIDPADLPSDTLLASFLKRCAEEETRGDADLELYELVRRFGWQLFTGQGLPAEFDE